MDGSEKKMTFSTACNTSRIYNRPQSCAKKLYWRKYLVYKNDIKAILEGKSVL